MVGEPQHNQIRIHTKLHKKPCHNNGHIHKGIMSIINCICVACDLLKELILNGKILPLTHAKTAEGKGVTRKEKQ